MQRKRWIIPPLNSLAFTKLAYARIYAHLQDFAMEHGTFSFNAIVDLVDKLDDGHPRIVRAQR